jgi:hypothetical protein
MREDNTHHGHREIRRDSSCWKHRWVYGLRPSFGILNCYKTMFWKLDLFPCSGERKETTALVGPVERANFIR